MFVKDYGENILKGLTGRRDEIPAIDPCYVGLLYDFSATEEIVYDPTTGEPIHTGNITYSYKEPNEVTSTFTGDADYHRALIGHSESKYSQVMSDIKYDWENVNLYTENEKEIYFTEALLDWPAITHIGFFKTESDGSMFMYAPLTESKEVKAESIPMFKVGTFKMTLS